MVGATVVHAVARELGVAESPTSRLLVVRAEAGCRWELLVVEHGAPRLCVLATVRRSPWPPWRRTRLSYRLTPLTPLRAATF
ncbi:hypothetical protein [Conexibacter woesei]|nr:hypothetical protein [Conexibacter woesei]